MSPTGLVHPTISSYPPNWKELVAKGRAERLLSVQRKMSTPSSHGTEVPAERQAATSSISPAAPATQAESSAAWPAVKTEPESGSVALALRETQSAAVADALLSSDQLAGGLVGASKGTAPESSAQEPAAVAAVAAPDATVAVQAQSNATPAASSDAGEVVSEGEALRTEVMGPPPTLPADPGYPPLNPVLMDPALQAPLQKRRGTSAATNGTQRKAGPVQAPADFVPPANLNGKMPYALFQTIKRSNTEPSTTNNVLSKSESISGDDAIATPKQGDAQEIASTLVDRSHSAVDPLLADVLTDADSVATATATRETSPEGSVVQDSITQATTDTSVPTQASLPSRSATPSQKPASLETTSSTPIGADSEVLDASPSVALRRNPSNRGASLLASQSITNAYADPMGLKKHRESLSQEDGRGRRSPSASSTGMALAAGSTSTTANAKKSSSARTIIPPPLTEPPAGQMYTPEGRLRTIPGIAGAIVQPGPSSSLNDGGLMPRLEDKGSANNDFCETCGGHGRFVCCDGCPRSFHFFCMNPPLDIDEMPPSNAAEVLGPNAAQKGKSKAGAQGSEPQLNTDEMWFCNVCVAERKPKAVSRLKGFGPFGHLLPILSQQNPKSFQLPPEVRTYFKDVSMANDGDYINGAMVRQLKPNRLGQIEERDPYRLKDKNGGAILCYRCGGTALPSEAEQDVVASNGSRLGSRKSGGDKSSCSTSLEDVAAALPAEPTIREGTGWRKIVSCDFCPLHWHIDCVDPPMLGMPSNLRKWMCPAHSDHVNDRRRVARIGAAVPKTLDLPVPSAKTIGPGKHFRTRVLNNGDIDIIPDPMEELLGVNGITGSLQSGIKEVAIVPGVVDSPALTAGGTKLASKIRYRFPEKVIRTDFWSKLQADDSNKIGSIFYVAASEIAHRSPVRLVAADDDVVPDTDATTRYRPFGRREYPRSGLDSLADIAAARLAADELALTEDPKLVRPSRTRQLIATALGIDLTNDDVPESSMRSSLDEVTESSPPSSSESPLSSLTDSENEVSAKGTDASAGVPAPQPAAPETPSMQSATASAPTLSEEELVKRIALEAATGVSSGDPIRLSKRKAAVAAESAIAGSPTTPAKKLRSASPAVTTTPARGGAVPVEARPTTVKKITVKTNGAAAKKEAKEGRGRGMEMPESQAALRMAYHLADQYAEERKEIEQLRAIRELMKLKGPARMLEFLLSPNVESESSASEAHTQS